MVRLQPEWIGELVSMCAQEDWQDVREQLGYPTVSPMFARFMPQTAEADDVTGYSSAEVTACRAGIVWLNNNYPLEYAALQWEFQPGKRHMLLRDDDHDALVLHAGRLLAKFVDACCS